MNKNDKYFVKEVTNIEEDFAKWYTDIVRKAELADYTDSKGFIAIRPYGYAIWENIQNYADNYLDLSKAAITVVHPETSAETISENYKNAQKLSFKGHVKEPVNMDKVSATVLDNNYKIAFTESKNNNTPFEIELYYDLPKKTSPATLSVLNLIYRKGTMLSDEKEFLKYQEENNISLSTHLSKGNLSIKGYSSAKNLDKTVGQAVEILNNPRVTDEEVSKAIDELKDTLSRYDNSIPLIIC